MNRQEFIDALRKRLTDEGFPADYVDAQCSTLTEKLNSLPDATAKQYTTARNLDIIVRKLLTQDANRLQKANPTEVSPSAEVVSDSESQPSERIADEKPAVSPRQAPRSDVEYVQYPARTAKKRRTARTSSTADYIPCDKPRLLTFLLMLICAPTIILLLGSAFGIFAGIFMVLAASIFVIVVAIIAIVGVGSVLSVASLLYGATQVLSTPRYIGFHELGFGLLIAGVTMAASILLYNLAIRLIPFIYLQMGKLLKLFSSKLVSFTKNAVKGCEQL